VGSLVGADDTLCLIEVMKLFNTVKAGIAGKVARILAENGKMVEQDQVLLLIEPAA
jgi:acetyl-CoA carboxylase biotin carboxyl carrier protein